MDDSDIEGVREFVRDYPALVKRLEHEDDRLVLVRLYADYQAALIGGESMSFGKWLFDTYALDEP